MFLIRNLFAVVVIVIVVAVAVAAVVGFNDSVPIGGRFFLFTQTDIGCEPSSVALRTHLLVSCLTNALCQL